MASLPSSGSEAVRVLLIGVAIVFLAIVGIYAVNALAAIGFVAALIVVAALVVWIVGGRLWDALRHGKPMIRNDWSGGEGGD